MVYYIFGVFLALGASFFNVNANANEEVTSALHLVESKAKKKKYNQDFEKKFLKEMADKVENGCPLYISPETIKELEKGQRICAKKYAGSLNKISFINALSIITALASIPFTMIIGLNKADKCRNITDKDSVAAFTLIGAVFVAPFVSGCTLKIILDYCFVSKKETKRYNIYIKIESLISNTKAREILMRNIIQNKGMF